MMMMIRV